MVVALALGVAFCVAVLAIVFTPKNSEASGHPCPCTRADPRCERTTARLNQAREDMHARGIPTLLDASARRPWHDPARH